MITQLASGYFFYLDSFGINCATCGRQTMRRKEKKDVVVIGNGPSAISLSYMLAGNWPYYSSDKQHPNQYLHNRLTTCNTRNIDDANEEHMKSDEISLVEQDLEVLCNGLEGRSINPVAVLFDTLQRPDADFGSDQPSCLEWRYSSSNSVDHIVLGKGRPGGAWDRMSECMETLTVSFSQWMQLPGMCMKSWKHETTQASSRTSLGDVARYYKEYVKRQGLEKYFRNNATVTEVRFDDSTNLWHVCGWQDTVGAFEYVTPKVVLATGNSDVPNKLNVSGEDLPFVLHSVSQLETVLHKTNRSKLDHPILIVGAGLSAADAVIACQQSQVPVKHVFRRHPDDPSLIFNQLPENIYPEYHDVHSNMKGNNTGFKYQPLAMHSVAEIKNNKEVVLHNIIGGDESNAKSRVTFKVSYVLVLIGKKPSVQFIKPSSLRQTLPHDPDQPLNTRSNPISIDPFSHQVIRVDGLYAMGPLVGDNFVRFIQGGALAIVNDLRKQRRKIEDSL